MAVRSLGACNRSTYHVPPSCPLSNTVTVQACASGVSMVASNTRDSARDLQNTYVYLSSTLQYVYKDNDIIDLPILDITHKPVNPLRPKLLITRKTFKAHGPLKWLKYTSV